MKLLPQVVSLLSVACVAVAQQQPSVDCTFYNFGQTYDCYLYIYNPDGLNNFTQISGTHLDGFTNADVNSVQGYGLSANIPEIICNTFPNLALLRLETQIIEIDDSSFSNCPRSLTEINLNRNSITSITLNAFSNLRDVKTIDLSENSLTTLPEYVFENQQNLWNLNLRSNLLEDISVTLFQPLEYLQYLDLSRNQLNGSLEKVFASNPRLTTLMVELNRIALSELTFAGPKNLQSLYLGYNDISVIPAGTFQYMGNLRSLYLYGNSFTELLPDSFIHLEELTTLHIASNPIEIIHENAFRGLENLATLYMNGCRLRQLNATSFGHLTNLRSIDLDSNQIEELGPGAFSPTPNVTTVRMNFNKLRILRRNAFGNLYNLQSLDVERNVINALDRTIIDDAQNLNALIFYENVCASEYFGSFRYYRAEYMVMLERCFSTFRHTHDTTTEAGEDYRLFEGVYPGIALSVSANSEVQIALTSSNFIWRPVIEIFIGTVNNTRSVIRLNQETNVVTVPTPNIIVRDQWNDFRITWAEYNVLVFRGNNSFPFMSYTMLDFYPVNFYGLRAVDTTASWTIQPVQ